MRVVLAPLGGLRQGQRHVRREFSTSIVLTNAARAPGLPPAKLRALISLYHLSSTFITPATLSDRIDSAFTGPQNSDNISGRKRTKEDLKMQLEGKRNEQKLGPAAVAYNGVYLDYNKWSDRSGVRQAVVNAALWGTEWDAKPSLETILEERGSDESMDQLTETGLGEGEHGSGFH